MATAVDPKTVAEEELSWFRDNPQPKSTPAPVSAG